MLRFRSKEEGFKVRSYQIDQSSTECEVLPSIKPVPLNSVENALRTLKESESLTFVKERKIRDKFSTHEHEGVQEIISLIDNSKLSFFRKLDLKRSIEKETSFATGLQSPRSFDNIPKTTIPDKIHSDVDMSTDKVGEDHAVIHKRLIDALRGGHTRGRPPRSRRGSDSVTDSPSLLETGESIAGESIAGESIAGESIAGESVIGESVAKDIAPLLVSLCIHLLVTCSPSEKVTKALQKDRDNALLASSRLGSVKNILDSIASFLLPIGMSNSKIVANLNPLLLIITSVFVWFIISILAIVASGLACRALLPGLNFDVAEKFVQFTWNSSLRLTGMTFLYSLSKHLGATQIVQSAAELIALRIKPLNPRLPRGVVSTQQPSVGAALQTEGDGTNSTPAPRDTDEDRSEKIIILPYVDNSFGSDLSFIDGLVKNLFLSLSSNIEVGKTLNRYLIMLWSLEAYPNLISGVSLEEKSKIKRFVKRKLSNFVKGQYEYEDFSPDIFIKIMKGVSQAGMSELDFERRHHIIPPYKVKIITDEGRILKWKRIIAELISEIQKDIQLTEK